MTTTVSVDLLKRLQQTLEQLERRIAALHIHRDEFSDWFDAELFQSDAEHPLDYPKEIRRHLQRLQQLDEPTQQAWLAEKISHQLTALHQALMLRERR